MSPLQTMDKFCARHNLEVQACRVFIDEGLIPSHTYFVGAKKFVIVDSEDLPLKEEVHYVMCPAKKLSIEVDGCYWHGCTTCGFPGVGYIQLIEKKKGTYLSNRGWTTIHVKECSIKSNLSKCVQEVIAFVEGAK